MGPCTTPMRPIPIHKRPVNNCGLAHCDKQGRTPTASLFAFTQNMQRQPMQRLLPLVLLLLLNTSAHAIRILDVIASPLQGTWINQADDTLRQAACTQWQQQKLPANSQLLVVSGQSAHYLDTAAHTQLYWHLSQRTASYTRNDSRHIQGLALAKTDITSPTETTLAFDFQLNPDDSLTAPLLPAQTFYRCTHASRPHKRPVN